MKILVAEDDPVLATVLVEAMSDEGHSVTRVADLASMREEAAAAAWDAFVLDSFGSPNALDDEFRSALRELAQRAPVILTTGRAWALAADPGEIGVHAILAKPYDLDDLLRTVSAAKPRPGT